MKALLTLFIVLLLSINQIKSNKMMQSTSSPISGYFFLLQLYPGTDPLDNVLYSETQMKHVFFQLNKNMLFYSKSESSPEGILDSLVLSDLYDPETDDAAKGKCCTRITYQHYPRGNSIKNILAAAIPPKLKSEEKDSKGASDSKKDDEKPAKPSCQGKCDSSDPITAPSPKDDEEKAPKGDEKEANYCLELHIPSDSRWRICSEKKDRITQLQLKLQFYILVQKNPSKKETELMDMFLSQTAPVKVIMNSKWDWHNQKDWKGLCKSSLMASPINLNIRDVKKPRVDFKVSYHFSAVHTLVKRNFDEIIVAFTNLAGVFKLHVHKSVQLFTPQYMSFRFPSEHTIDGKRAPGEIRINLVEMTEERKLSSSNGLSISIPLSASADALSVKSFEDLNIDFWKFAVKREGYYTPSSFINKEMKKFNLGEIFDRALKGNGQWLLYFGSNTAPPCKHNVYHLVLSKPLEIANCQFKLIRENSLVTNRIKEIHARMLQRPNNRNVYSVGKSQIAYVKHVEPLVPVNYSKYLLAENAKTTDAKPAARVVEDEKEDCPI